MMIAVLSQCLLNTLQSSGHAKHTSGVESISVIECMQFITTDCKTRTLVNNARRCCKFLLRTQ